MPKASARVKGDAPVERRVEPARKVVAWFLVVALSVATYLGVGPGGARSACWTARTAAP